MKEKILKLIEDYWKFDNDQQPTSSWHDKQDLLKAVYEMLTPPPRDNQEMEIWFKETFDEVASEYGNSETAESVEINGKDPMVINFYVDADDYGLHRNNRIRITKDKKLIVELAEIIEGGDIEAQLIKRIEEKIK